MKRTTAAGSAAGLYVDYVAGVTAGTLLVAEDRNNVQEEICNMIESIGWALDSTDQYQLSRSVVAKAKGIGEIVLSEIKLTPVIASASKSTVNPAYPEYLPIIARHDADHDVTSTQAPDLVTAYRAYAAEVMGSASFTATWAASVGTFANNATNNALLAAIQEDALVQRWFSSSQSATYAGSGGDYTGGRCINVAGTDFAITAVNTGSRTITVTGTPTAGSQTVIFYPYRIAGSSTSVRLHRLSGMVGVASQDSDSFEIAGMRHMDMGQGHYHHFYIPTSATGGSDTAINAAALNAASGADLATGNTPVRTIVTDGANGTPRTGKNTTPRSVGRYCYTWARRLIA